MTFFNLLMWVPFGGTVLRWFEVGVVNGGV